MHTAWAAGTPQHVPRLLRRQQRHMDAYLPCGTLTLAASALPAPGRAAPKPGCHQHCMSQYSAPAAQASFHCRCSAKRLCVTACFVATSSAPLSSALSACRAGGRRAATTSLRQWPKASPAYCVHCQHALACCHGTATAPLHQPLHLQCSEALHRRPGCPPPRRRPRWLGSLSLQAVKLQTTLLSLATRLRLAVFSTT